MPLLTLLTFVALALSVGAVWLQSSSRRPFAPWQAVFAAALLCGWQAGVLQAPALVALALFAGVAWLTDGVSQKFLRILFGVLTLVLAFALAIHKLPGFDNPVVIAGAVFSEGGKPFTQYANFDKGAVGLVLLAFICRRATSWPELSAALKKTWPILLVTIAAVMAFAVGVGFVHPDFKLPSVTLQFIAVNLFFTVVAEETFFRGFLQARLAASLARFRNGQWIAVICSALLFGAAHLAGGPAYALVATIAGLGYAYAYQATQRIEAPILIHIVLNTVHFIGFTYPFAAR
ncbi:CPBP family intramembrane metalloprotease [Rugamonas sp. FT107W]|uniref:CPBP family intramembrane metalloprotease n=1 Tax=Duganella vulcania TaxID=2692166 RepID=A0A845HK54_9BURK|nr:CPBP family intramembrane glutamic endopeptidase [Duganella vulcania]MYN18787.1 CPBP family intramembrane metalloprotease [Duganella vulcania]